MMRSAVIILIPLLLAAGIAAVYWLGYANPNASPTNIDTDSMIKITFNERNYSVADTLQTLEETNFTAEGREWVAENETLENWTSLITTNKRTPTTGSALYSAEMYTEDVLARLEQTSNALVLEASRIDQDTESLDIDPEKIPFLLVHLFVIGDTTEFVMQKIVPLDDGAVGSMSYIERFPTKSEPEMKAYYDSPERRDKRIELIKFTFPY